MPIVTKTWIGGGNNEASNPADWSGVGAPRPGYTLIITHGTMNVSGNDLAGDPLNLAYSGVAESTITINTRNNATLNIGGFLGGDTHVSVHVAGQIHLTYNAPTVAGSLHFIGGSIDMVGTSKFQGVTFDSNLTGNGTIIASHGGNGSIFGPTEFNGSVGSGLTVALDSGGPPEHVEIAHPTEFRATLVIPSQHLFGSVLFEGLHVTRADLTSSHVLELWNGRHLVDTVRLGGSPNNLVVQQLSTGVTLWQSDPGQHVTGNLLH